MIDLDLVDAIVNAIPPHTWPKVKSTIVVNFVDAMSGDVLQRLTGNRDGFELAEEILENYYVVTDDPDMQHELITDAIKILGTEPLTYLLDSMQLDKVPVCQQ
jgi:hypothetical protein